MRITKNQLRTIVKEELDTAMGQKVYLVTVGYGSTAVGIFSSMEAAEKAVLRDIESEHQEQAGRSRADYGADTTAKREDYNIDEYILDKGRS